MPGDVFGAVEQRRIAAGQQATVVAEGCAPAVTSYDVNGPAGATDVRRLRIEVTLGGRTRMCDRDKVLSAANPDGCTP